jgi:hypothetical protein
MSSITDLLTATAHEVFSRETNDPWEEVNKAGLAEISDEVTLSDVAAIVRISAYYATEIEFAERVMLPVRDDHLRGALMRSVQMGGAISRVLEMTVSYARDRHQFGVPLNRFQAVQQQLARLAAEAAAADAAVTAAVEYPDDRRQVAAAKVRTGQAAGIASTIAHQVHGAIGFTHEHALHRWTTKLWRWRDDFGTEAFWARELGHDLLTAGADRCWELSAG